MLSDLEILKVETHIPVYTVSYVTFINTAVRSSNLTFLSLRSLYSVQKRGDNEKVTSVRVSHQNFITDFVSHGSTAAVGLNLLTH
jgi:hypothetical protein